MIPSARPPQDLCLATNKLGGEGWAFLLPLRRLSQLDLRHQLGNRRLALPAGLLALPSLQVQGWGSASIGLAQLWPACLALLSRQTGCASRGDSLRPQATGLSGGLALQHESPDHFQSSCVLSCHPKCLLQVLQCADNPFTTSLPGPAVVPAPSAPGRLALQTLSLDFEVAARSHDALRALPSLRALWLVAAQGQVGVAAPGLKVRA